MGTKIANSVITTAKDPSANFTVTGDFEVIVKSGSVQLETQIDGVFYKVSEVQSGVAKEVTLPAGTVTKIAAAETGRTYRLTPITTATAEAWQL